MKVILTKDVAGLGRAGDVKEVSDGHARNFLLPRHLVLPATRSSLQKLQKEEQERIDRAKRQDEKFLAVKNKIQSKTFIIKGKAEKQHLFAAIHEDQIAKVLSDSLSLELHSSQIVMSKPIKNLGLHEVEIRFNENHIAKINLEVQSI